MKILKGVGFGFIGIIVVLVILDYINKRPQLTGNDNDNAIALVKNAQAFGGGRNATIEQVLMSSIEVANSTGSKSEYMGWSCFEDGPNTYGVVFKYTENEARRMASWRVDIRTGVIEPLDDLARQAMSK